MSICQFSPCCDPKLQRCTPQWLHFIVYVNSAPIAMANFRGEHHDGGACKKEGFKWLGMKLGPSRQDLHSKL